MIIPKSFSLPARFFGRLFALNGGGFGAEGLGDMFHLSADNNSWTSLEVGYLDFLCWCLTGDLMRIYEPLAALDVFNGSPRPAFDNVYSVYPFLWSYEARNAVPDVRIVPADENIALRFELVKFATA